MRSKSIILIVLVCSLCVFLSGCGNKSYTITFDSAGGEKLESIKVSKEGKIELPENPTKEGYIFNGWYLDGQLFNDSMKLEKNITLVAEWIEETANIFKVLFIYNNDTKDLEVNVEANNKIEEPIKPSKSGYKFIGWYNGDVKYDFNTEVTTDLILFAKWEVIEVPSNNTSNSGNNNSNNTNNNNTSNSDQKEDTAIKDKKTIDATKEYYCYDSSYKLNGDKCEKTLTTISVKEYYCSEGYVLSGTSCTKTIHTTETKPATINYYCTSPYTLNGNKCEYTLSSEALTRYYCSSGTLSGSSCISYTKFPLVQSVRQWCANSGLSGSGSCPSAGCNAVGGIYDRDLYNSDSSSLYWCYKLQESSTSAKQEYYCPSGYTLVGNQCTKFYQLDAPFNASCPSGYTFNGSECAKNVSTTDRVNASYTYSCPVGYTENNSTCEKKFEIDANYKHVCPKGYTLSSIDKCTEN